MVTKKVLLGALFFLCYGLTATPTNPLLEAITNNDYLTLGTLLSHEKQRAANNTDFSRLLEVSLELKSFECMAQLLRHGANIATFKKLVPKMKHAELHTVRETYQRLPDPQYIPKNTMGDLGATYLKALQNNGFVKITDLLSPHQVDKLKQDFSRFIKDINELKARGELPDQSSRELYKSDKDNTYMSNNPFKYSAELIRLCCNPLITEVINNYLGKVGYIHKGLATRYTPGKTSGNGVFGWHHDAAGKRVKILILLSDTPEDARCTTYIPGSHAIAHDFEHYQCNNLGPEYCHHHLSHVEVVKFTGNPGDIYLFDTNGIHSANAGQKGRDAFLISYSTDMGHIRPYPIDENVIKSCDCIDKNPFNVLLKIQNKDPLTFPRSRHWTGSLKHVETWLLDQLL